MAQIGIVPLRFEDSAGNTAHTVSPDSGPHSGWWSGTLRLSGIGGRTAARKDTFVASRDRGSRGAGHTFDPLEWQLDYIIEYDGLVEHATRLRTLRGELRAMEAREYWLVFSEDHAGSVVTKRVRCTVQGLVPSDAGLQRAHFVVVITITGTRYYDYTPSTTTGTAIVVGNSGTLTWSNTSTTPTDDVAVKVTPTAQKGRTVAQRWTRQLTLVNRNEGPLHRWPIELTRDLLTGATGWDHAALVAAGTPKSAASGYDVEIYVEGYLVYRTDYTEIANGAFNESATLLWANLTMESRRTWTLSQADGTGTTLHLVEPVDSQMALPTYFVYVNGTNSEVIKVTAQDAEAGTWTVERGLRGTSAQSLAAGAVLYWSPLDVRLVYGWVDATAPHWDDKADRPMILDASTSQSTNLRWYWKRFLQSPTTGDPMGRYNRPASWQPVDNVRMSHDREFHDGKGELYTRWGGFTAAGAAHANPATALSIAYAKNGPPDRTPYANCWRWLSQIPIKAFNATVAATTLGMAAPNEGMGELHAVDWLGRVQRLGRYFSGVDQCGVASDASSGAVSFTFAAPVRGIEASVHPWTPQPDACNHENVIPQQPAEGDNFTVTAPDQQFADDLYPLVLWGPEHQGYQIGRPTAPCTLTDQLGHTLSIYGVILDLSESEYFEVDCLTGSARVYNGASFRSVAHRVAGEYLRLSADAGTITLTEPDAARCVIEVTGRSAYG